MGIVTPAKTTVTRKRVSLVPTTSIGWLIAFDSDTLNALELHGADVVLIPAHAVCRRGVAQVRVKPNV
jgi:hypothetical protein